MKLFKRNLFKRRFWSFKGLEPHAGAMYLSIWDFFEDVIDGIYRIVCGFIFIVLVCTAIMAFLKFFSLV